MPKVSADAMREVEAALKQYDAEVHASGLQPKTVRTYVLHATNFVRWLKDDFVPGEKV
jgi:hypothetical protein